ncbi:hypothetical protein K5E_26060 [Enterococcus thailandicus]|uniref:Uncharacterized protein n=1 Tax=Enterococcus mundtii TaxID=53346 RepID=A0A2S7RYR0_ENTMU|nr:hypothetical protein CUS89_01850 [Enterococcus mundtii]REC26839.1 hypothetical protein CF160_14425 [Enterococcus pseudoavium]GMC02478.1 hypothetical protein K2F_27400 [Enterococcus thailandicus]REC31479.1 hypothetical protein CF160_03045 [Enterococcus pseudoavium]GMC04761.1 hypothetical protein K4E_23320 [Enterococcus thailandicus]
MKNSLKNSFVTWILILTTLFTPILVNDNNENIKKIFIIFYILTMVAFLSLYFEVRKEKHK